MQPAGLKCARCEASPSQAHKFGHTTRSHLPVYRCVCGRTYNVYTGTIFERRRLTPVQVALLLCGIVKGQITASLSRALDLNYNGVMRLRHKIQANAECEQPRSVLVDVEAESDEVFQSEEKKSQV